MMKLFVAPDGRWARVLGLALLVVCAVATSARAQTLVVRQDGLGDHTTIQAAIDAIPGGPTSRIIVHPGVYAEDLTIASKDIDIFSIDPGNPAIVATTVVASPTTATGFTSITGTSNAFRIRGLTFDQNTVDIVDGTATFSQCSFLNDESIQIGIILGDDGRLFANGCRFVLSGAFSNAIGWVGDALGIELTNCTIVGSGIILQPLTDPGPNPPELNINNCTFVQANFVVLPGSPGGASIPVTISNSIFWPIGSAAFEGPFPQNMTVRHSLVDELATSSAFFTDGGGNFDADPMFVDPSNQDFRLMPGSPAIDAGLDAYVPTWNEANDRVDSDAPFGRDGNRDLRFVNDPTIEATPCTFFATDIGLAIPDNGGAVGVNLTLTDAPTSIDRLEIPLEIMHTFVQDLIFEITSPEGTTVRLWDRDCNGENDIFATFADGASFPNCSSSIEGRITPTQALGAFRGEDANGVWQFVIQDFAAQDTGSVDSIAFVFRSSNVDLGANEFQDVGTQAIRSERIDPNPAEAGPIRFRTRFAEPVTGVDATDALTISLGGVNNQDVTVTGVAPSAGMRFENQPGSVITADLPSERFEDGMIIDFWVWQNSEAGVAPFTIQSSETPTRAAVELRFPFPPGTTQQLDLSWGNSGLGTVSSIGNQTWHHIAVVFTDSTVVPGRIDTALYIDGEFIADFPNTLLYPSLQTLEIGGNTLRGEYWEGRIDELRIWDSTADLDALLSSRFKQSSGREPGLVGYWPLDEIDDLGVGAPGPNDTPDLSVNGLHADIGTALEMSNIGPFEGGPAQPFPAFDRAERDFVRIPDGGAEYFQPTGFTIEATVRAGTIPNDMVARIISTDTTGGAEGWGFGQYLNGRLFFTTYGLRDYFSNATPFTPGEWVHVAAVFDSSADVHFYVDGQLVQTVTGTAPIGPWTNDLLIGGARPTFQNWDGNIREVRLWGDERTAGEIFQFYDKRIVATAPDLIGHWPLDSFGDMGVGAPGYNDVRDASFRDNHADASPLDQTPLDRYFTNVFVADAGSEGTVQISYSSVADGTIRTVFGQAGDTGPEDSEAYTLVPGFCLADFNSSGSVDIFDILEFLTAWQSMDPRADVIEDGTFTIFDVLAFLDVWQMGCT